MPQHASERTHALIPTSQTSSPPLSERETRGSSRRRNRSRRRIRALICAGGAVTVAAALSLTAVAEPPALADAAFVTGSELQDVTVPRDVTVDSDQQPIAPSSPGSSAAEKETKVSTLSNGKPEVAKAEPAVEAVQSGKASAKPTKKPGKKPAKKPDEKPALLAPLSDASVASPYGNRVNPMVGSGQEMHTGTDYAEACGTPVLASNAGTVTESGWHPYGGGQRIVVDHGKGLKTTYNHLSSLGAAVGDEVDRGKPIGAVGTTGNSTGCHLHFEVVINGKTVDPSLHL